MDYSDFYAQLFAPLEVMLGPFDADTLAAVIGFDEGGPLSFCTLSGPGAPDFTTYVSCELAVRDEQKPSSFGRYELLVTCNDERWVRSVVSDIGRMSLDVTFDHGHTLDIGACVESTATIQGVVFETAYRMTIDRRPYGLLRVLGVTGRELEYARRDGVSDLLARLRNANVHPKTDLARDGIF